MKKRTCLKLAIAGVAVLTTVITAKARAEGWHTVHGGGGGEEHVTTLANYDGIHMWSAGFIDRISFKSFPTAWTEVWGNGDLGGTDRGQQACINNYIVGITGRSGLYLDALGIICTPDPSNYTYSYTVGYTGGGGGNYFRDLCAPNEIVRRIRVRTGGWVDSIQIYCARL